MQATARQGNQPAPVRHFQRYNSEQRADLAASHRLTRRQRQSIGEVFWTIEVVPGIAFKTRKAAMVAAKVEA